MTTTEDGGAREARKLRTRAALTTAALTIVEQEGIESLTAARVADEADVSRRTLFNYFPRVEDVLTAGLADLVDAGIQVFLARPTDEPLRDSVLVVVDEVFSHDSFAQVRSLERAAQESAATHRLLLEYCDLQTDALEDALHRRLGPDADPVFVTGLSAATQAVLARIGRLSLSLDGDLDDDAAAERHRDRLRSALALIFDGFSASAPPPATHPTHPTDTRVLQEH